MKKTQKIPQMHKKALLVLQGELPIILLAALILLIRFLTARTQDPLGAAELYLELCSYILVSLGISVGTALLSDLVLREAESIDQDRS